MTDPTLVDSLLEEGLNLFGANKVDEAVAVWRKVLEVAPGEPRAVDFIQTAGYAVAPPRAHPPATFEPRASSPPPPHRGRASLVAVGAVAVVGLGAVLAFGIHRAVDAGAGPDQVAQRLSGAAAATSPSEAQPESEAAPSPEPAASTVRAAALRREALAHVLRDEYDQAAAKVTEALTLSDSDSDLVEILALIKERQNALRLERSAAAASKPNKKRAAKRVRRTKRAENRLKRMAAASAKEPPAPATTTTRDSPLAPPVSLATATENLKKAAPARRLRKSSVRDPLPSDMSRVCVRSEDAGHTVVINGRAFGSAPIDVDLTPGSVNIELRKNGQTLDRRTIKTSGGKVKRVVF